MLFFPFAVSILPNPAEDNLLNDSVCYSLVPFIPKHRLLLLVKQLVPFIIDPWKRKISLLIQLLIDYSNSSLCLFSFLNVSLWVWKTSTNLTASHIQRALIISISGSNSWSIGLTADSTKLGFFSRYWRLYSIICRTDATWRISLLVFKISPMKSNSNAYMCIVYFY